MRAAIEVGMYTILLPDNEPDIGTFVNVLSRGEIRKEDWRAGKLVPDPDMRIEIKFFHPGDPRLQPVEPEPEDLTKTEERALSVEEAIFDAPIKPEEPEVVAPAPGSIDAAQKKKEEIAARQVDRITDF